MGKLLYLAKKSCNEISNAICKLTHFVSMPSMAHMKAMYHVMKHVVGTPNCGKLLKPGVKWDGSKDFLFELWGQTDSDHAKDPTTHCSVSGYGTFLFDAPINGVSHMQKNVALSVNESECGALVECVQDLIFEK